MYGTWNSKVLSFSVLVLLELVAVSELHTSQLRVVNSLKSSDADELNKPSDCVVDIMERQSSTCVGIHTVYQSE